MHYVQRKHCYIDNLELQYNTLKVARYLAKLKHSITSIKQISPVKVKSSLSEATKLSANTQQHAIFIIYIYINTEEKEKSLHTLQRLLNL